jgi:hypothetical protein
LRTRRSWSLLNSGPMLTTFRRQKRKLTELYECLKQRYEGGRPMGTSSPLFLPKNLVASPQGEPPSFGAQSNPKFGSISFPSRVREQELAPRHPEVDRTHLQGIFSLLVHKSLFLLATGFSLLRRQSPTGRSASRLPTNRPSFRPLFAPKRPETPVLSRQLATDTLSRSPLLMG